MSWTPFWYSWKSSWAVELLGGLSLAIAVTVITAWAPHASFWTWLGRFVFGMIGSVWYESHWDPNKWSTTDVLQRTVGFVGGLIVLWAIFGR